MYQRLTGVLVGGATLGWIFNVLGEPVDKLINIAHTDPDISYSVSASSCTTREAHLQTTYWVLDY